MSKISFDGQNLTLEYNLFDLPTAQHKAGLAGLLVMIESLRFRKIPTLPIVEFKPNSVNLSFSEDSLKTVFDDLYDVEPFEVKLKKLKTKKENGKEIEVSPKHTEVVTTQPKGRKKKEQTYYIYDDFVPKGAFLQTFFSDGNGKWVKLWRDTLWNILRVKPASKGVYEERAPDKDGKQKSSSKAKKFWEEILKAYNAHKKGQTKTDSLSSSIVLGMESQNAEKVPFKGAIEDNFLLNFWHIVSLIFVPRELKIERSEDKISINRSKELGFVFVIPEPSNLQDFVEEVIQVIRSLPTEVIGYRPKKALIDLYQEGGLEFLYWFTRNKIDNTGGFLLNLQAIEIFHLEKQSDSARQLSSEQILKSSDKISEDRLLRDSKKPPFYKIVVLKNLVNGHPWYKDALNVLQNQPWPIFILSTTTPHEIPFFCYDVKSKFHSIEKNIQFKKEANLMSERDFDDKLALCIYKLVQQYIWRKTEEKSGKKYEEFKTNRDNKGRILYPAEYRDSLGKVSSEAFLSMRGRSEDAFVEYFSGTICSVPQFLPQEEYLSVVKALSIDWQKMKTLSMLAVSANSFLSE